MSYLIITVILIAIILFFYNEKQKRLKKEELERRRIEAEELRLKNIAELAELHKNQRKNINPFFSKIDHYNKTLTIFFDSPKFISNYDLFKFKELHISLYKKIKALEYKHLPYFDK